MNTSYIIPANSKKQQLILGYFTPLDLILFISGSVVSLMLLLLIPNPNIVGLIFMLLPVLVTAFLVLPVPHYHNVLQFLINIWSFYIGRRKYFWRGWCINSESSIEQ